MSFENDKMGITKESEKIICYLYRCFLKKRDKGESKTSAKEFNDNFWRSNKKLSKWNSEDIEVCLLELQQHNYIKRNILGDIILTDSVIVYMENRFSRGLSDVWGIITDLL